MTTCLETPLPPEV